MKHEIKTIHSLVELIENIIKNCNVDEGLLETARYEIDLARCLWGDPSEPEPQGVMYGKSPIQRVIEDEIHTRQLPPRLD